MIKVQIPKYEIVMFNFIDINECVISPSICHVNANCQNNEGSYLCSCKPGFNGDGKTCQGITWMIKTEMLNILQLYLAWGVGVGVQRCPRCLLTCLTF